MKITFSLGLVALASGCLFADSDAPEAQAPDTSTQTAAIGTSACVYGGFAPSGGFITGWSVDLCNGVPASSSISVHTGGPGRRDIFYANCEYYENSFIWCSPDAFLTVDINGVSYSGWFGYNIDVHAGGQLGGFNAQFIRAGELAQDTIPFVHSF